MEPDSDEELGLMGEVELLESQLKKAGEPVNQKYADMFLKSLENKALAERIKKWNQRKASLQTLVADLPGGQAASAPVRDDKGVEQSPRGPVKQTSKKVSSIEEGPVKRKSKAVSSETGEEEEEEEEEEGGSSRRRQSRRPAMRRPTQP